MPHGVMNDEGNQSLLSSLHAVLDVVPDEVGDLRHHVRHRRGEDDAGAEARQDRQPRLRLLRVRVPRQHFSQEFESFLLNWKD